MQSVGLNVLTGTYFFNICIDSCLPAKITFKTNSGEFAAKEVQVVKTVYSYFYVTCFRRCKHFEAGL